MGLFGLFQPFDLWYWMGSVRDVLAGCLATFSVFVLFHGRAMVITRPKLVHHSVVTSGA